MGSMKTLTETMLSNRFFALLDAGGMHSRAEALGALLIFWHAAHSRAAQTGTMEELKRLMPGNDAGRSLLFAAMLDAGYLEPADAEGTQYTVVDNALYDEPNYIRSAKRKLARDKAKALQVKGAPKGPGPKEQASTAAVQPAPAGLSAPKKAEDNPLFAPAAPKETPEEIYERSVAKVCFDTYAKYVHQRCGYLPQATPMMLVDLRYVVRRLGVERAKEALRFYVQERSEPSLVRDRWPLKYFRDNVDGLYKMARVAEAARMAGQAVQRSTKAALAH